MAGFQSPAGFQSHTGFYYRDELVLELKPQSDQEFRRHMSIRMDRMLRRAEKKTFEDDCGPNGLMSQLVHWLDSAFLHEVKTKINRRIVITNLVQLARFAGVLRIVWCRCTGNI